MSERIVGHGTDGIRIFASVGFLSFQVSLSSYRAGRAPYEVPGGFSKGDVIILMVFFVFGAFQGRLGELPAHSMKCLLVGWRGVE